MTNTPAQTIDLSVLAEYAMLLTTLLCDGKSRHTLEQWRTRLLADGSPASNLGADKLLMILNERQDSEG